MKIKKGGKKRKGGRRIKTYDTGSVCSRLPGFRCDYNSASS